MEAVDVLGAEGDLDHALVSPIHLALSSGEDRETAVELGRAGADALPGFLHIELHPLVGAGEVVFRHQTLVDHGGVQAGLPGEHGVDLGRKAVNQALLGPPAHRGRGRRLGREVLLCGAPVASGFPGDVCPSSSRLHEERERHVGSSIPP